MKRKICYLILFLYLVLQPVISISIKVYENGKQLERECDNYHGSVQAFLEKCEEYRWYDDLEMELYIYIYHNSLFLLVFIIEPIYWLIHYYIHIRKLKRESLLDRKYRMNKSLEEDELNQFYTESFNIKEMARI